MPLYGPKFPLSKGNHDTFELYDEVKGQISFYLKNLLLTSPGENISDPSYGIGLRRYLFEPNNSSTRQNISYEISSQIRRYLPFIILEDVGVSADSSDIDSNSIRVKIIYSIPGDALSQVFELEANPDTTIGFY